MISEKSETEVSKNLSSKNLMLIAGIAAVGVPLFGLAAIYLPAHMDLWSVGVVVSVIVFSAYGGLSVKRAGEWDD